jgi:nucleoside-diphosphate-sugar epimerase
MVPWRWRTSPFPQGVERFVFTSTSNVYSPGLNRPGREDDPVHPTATYPQSKVAAEQALLDLYRTQGLGVRILRLGFVYGEGDPHVHDTDSLTDLREWVHGKTDTVGDAPER